MLAEILKQKPNYKCMTDREKNELLAYLISDGDTTKLEGLDLLLLASAEWGTFKQNGSLKYVCSEIEVNMFQGNGHHFIMPYEKLDQRSKDVMRFICDKKNYPIKDIDDDFLKKLLLETIQSHLGKELIITENINLNLDWLREVWNATTYRGIQRYLDVPIFPVLESGSFESNYQVKLVPLHNTNLLLKKVHTNIREQCLDDELEKCLRLLGITIVTQLPSWLLSDSIMDFVMFPSNDDVKEILQKTARIIDQEAIHVFNEKASDSNRARFLDFLAHVCPLNGDLLHLLQQLRLFMSIRPPGTFVCAQSSTFFVRESEKDQFPVNIQYPDHCILVKKSDEVIAELLGCTHMTLCTFMQLKLNGVQLDVFTNDSKHVILYFLKNIDKFDNVIDTASEIPFIKNTVGQSVKPSEVFDPFDEFLKRLFHGEDVFPSAVDDIRPYRNAFIKLGMKRNE
ncbi:hypothetical protein DPMN_154866 [Dreissena polymorpha]|uniref:Uncharacterized protein n=2 Tax=Dreissena polymorpha TaxID=45954 RepID=A0A9D4FLB6_DREPO|nr:hypothetical protein DPMN_154866 [Dreissena polymorpha]